MYGRLSGRAGPPGHPGASAPDLPAAPYLGAASRQEGARPLLATQGCAKPRMASPRRRGTTLEVVPPNDARGRRARTHRQARAETNHRGSVPLYPQPRLPLHGVDLHRDSRPSERPVGHPFLAGGALRDPARGDRARGALPRTYLRRGVLDLQGEGATLGIGYLDFREFTF